MARSDANRRGARHVSETPATQALRRAGVDFSEHPYAYVDRGGTAESARQLGVAEHAVVKTLVMQDEAARPLVVLMHGDRQVSTKNLARAIGAKSVQPCTPDVAQRHSGYQVGGTSPFGLRKPLPVWVERSVLALPRVLVNGGRRGFLVGIDPQALVQALGARPVDCAIAPMPAAGAEPETQAEAAAEAGDRIEDGDGAEEPVPAGSPGTGGRAGTGP